MISGSLIIYIRELRYLMEIELILKLSIQKTFLVSLLIDFLYRILLNGPKTRIRKNPPQPGFFQKLSYRVYAKSA